MSRTFKHMANNCRFKKENRTPKSRKIRELVEVMGVKYAGYRHGNNRKSSAKSKVIDRRIQRCKDKREMKGALDE